MSDCINNSSNQNSVKVKSSSSHYIAVTKMCPQKSTGTVNGGKHPVQNHLRTEQKINITDKPTFRKKLSSPCTSKLDNRIFEDISIFETQKLHHVVSWRELLLDEHHTGDSPKETSQLFVRAILDHDSEKKVIQESRDTINKRPEYLDLTLLHTGASNGLSCSEISENILEQTEKGPTSLSDSSLEEICPAQTIKYDQEFQEQREAKVWGECEVEGHKYSTSIKNSHIMCKRDYSFSTTVDLHESLDSYFWPPLNDSSDEEWTDVVKAKRDTLTKTHITPPNSTNFLKSDHMIHTNISVLGDGLPSTRSATSFEKTTLAVENLAEIGEKNKFKDFIWTLKSDNSSGSIDGAENTIKQVISRNIPFDPESQKDGLNCLSFHSQKKSKVQKKGTKSVHMAGMDKRFEENKCIGNEQTDNPFKGENNTGGQTELELSLKKNPSMLIHSLSTSFVLKSQGNTAWEVSPDSFGLHYKNNHGCVEGDNAIQNSAPKYVQDDINEYVSKDIIESPIGPKSSSVEFHIPRVKVDGIKKLFGYDKVLSNTYDNDNVLAQYYFYLNYLSQSKKPQLEEGNHSFSCEKLHDFSQEETLPIHCLSKNSNSMKDADTEVVDHDFGPSEKNCHKDKRAELIKPPEEQESKSLFTNSCPRSMPHLALTDKGKLGTLHSSKDQIISEIKKTGTNVADTRKCWEISCIARSSCTHGELKSRSQHVERPASANKIRKKVSNKCWSLPFSGKESRQQHGTTFQGDEERNVKSNGDNSVLSWLLLPDELWLCIFSLLTHKDISRVAQVCHHFYQLAADKSLWKDIKIVNCSCLNDDWLINLGSHLPQSFTVDHCHSENQKITEVGLKQFFQQCKGSLKELNIKNCSGPGLRGDTVLFHASLFCNLLTTVDVSWTGSTDCGLISLVTAAESLQCLSANGCQITDYAIAALVEKHGKSLRKLEILGCHAVTEKYIRYVAMKCPNIKVLNIGRIYKVTADCLAKVVNNMKKLTCLDITGLNTVKDCVVHFIAMKCPELECLVLNSCSQVTDLSLMEISTYLPTIRYLDVSGCKGVTDTGVQALAGSCQKLFYLDLSSTAISKRGVCSLASFCFRTLECVKISFCKAITSDAIAKLCKNCKRLKILHLYGCSFMPDLESIKKINKNVEVFHDLPIQAAKLSSE